MTEEPSSSNPTQPVDPLEPAESEVQLIQHKKNFVFLAAALTGVFVLFAVVGAFMSRSANLNSVEKQREYNEEYDSLTPSTSQNRASEETYPDDENVQEVDAIVIEDLDSQLDEIDTELNKL